MLRIVGPTLSGLLKVAGKSMPHPIDARQPDRSPERVSPKPRRCGLALRPAAGSRASARGASGAAHAQGALLKSYAPDRRAAALPGPRQPARILLPPFSGGSATGGRRVFTRGEDKKSCHQREFRDALCFVRRRPGPPDSPLASPEPRELLLQI